MSEFQEIEKLLSRYKYPSFRCSFVKNEYWSVEVYSTSGLEISHKEYRLDTALTLVLQDLREMANE